MDDTLAVPRKLTTLEVVIGLMLLFASALIIWTQYQDIMAQHRDSSRKVAVNAIQSNLEEVLFSQNNAYPEVLNPKTFSATDSALLSDTNGILINQPGPEYRYEPSSCTNGLCQNYILRAILEKEAPFIQQSAR